VVTIKYQICRAPYIEFSKEILNSQFSESQILIRSRYIKKNQKVEKGRQR
jgi:hypothetical protein